MRQRLSPEAREVLKRGTFCLMAAFPGDRVHVTPVVYVVDGGRMWLTTSRSSIKARTWRRDPTTSGLVEHGGLAVTFRGVCRSFDLMDPGTWAASALRSPALTRAAARFSLKNARFFAGYARDAHRVPLSWTPPARVFTSVEVVSAALLDVRAGTVIERWGDWPDGVAAAPFRSRGGSRRAAHVPGLPAEVTKAVGTSGDGAIGLAGVEPVVLPCRWRADGSVYSVAISADHLRLAGAEANPAAGLTAQRPSAWRAREMRGILVEGTASVHVVQASAGGRTAAARALSRAGGEPDHDVLLRLRPDRVVWWSGWSTGTVADVTGDRA